MDKTHSTLNHYCALVAFYILWHRSSKDAELSQAFMRDMAAAAGFCHRKVA